MYELRILNGLHRGATLPLDGHGVTIGADEQADVVMADHGIAADHALLSPNGDGWLLSATGGAVYADGHYQPQPLVDLEPGQAARVGDIWLCVAEQDSAWMAPPPMPAPEPDFDARADSAARELEQQEQQAAEGGAPTGATAASAEDASSTQGAASAINATTAGSKAPPTTARSRWRRRGAVMLLAMVAAMLAATAYALTMRPPLPLPGKSALATTSSQDNSNASNNNGDSGNDNNAAGPSAPSAAGTAAPATNAALAALFRKRLADAELLSRFDLTLNDRAWSMQAHLDDEESARFERILNNFIKEHHITFPVSAKSVTAEAMLPFRVAQVISGANPSVVTQEGARLYVGDDYRGVRVVAIQANRVTFYGKRKIEVLW
jgi:type III secretion protein D